MSTKSLSINSASGADSTQAQEQVVKSFSSSSYNPTYMPQILITDFTCEIHDRDGELITVKFTYQYSDRRPLLPTDYLSVDHERIFTNPYNPTFN